MRNEKLIKDNSQTDDRPVKIRDNPNPCNPWTSFFAPLRLRVIIIPVIFFLLSACSTAPRRPQEIFTERNMATNHLRLADHTANRGNYEDALLILGEARRLALATDDPVLIVRTSMSRANILFAKGFYAEAFADWEAASAEGIASGETVLAALARIYAIRARLILLDRGENAGSAANKIKAEELLERLHPELHLVRADAFAAAAGNITLGLAEKQLRRWDEAERAARRALTFYERNRMLEDAAYAWFVIASIRSTAGNLDAAMDALNAAIRFDRRAENGYGLAASWRAMAEIHQRAGRLDESRAALHRAVNIYRAIGLFELANELEEKL